MDVYKNAGPTPHGRERLAKMILGGQPPQAASEAAGVCRRTGRKGASHLEQEGLAGLQDRSSRPSLKRLYRPTPPEGIKRIASLRRQRMPGKEIAATVGVSPAAVSRVLECLGLSKLSALDPAEPPRRYERELPGEMATAIAMRPPGPSRKMIDHVTVRSAARRVALHAARIGGRLAPRIVTRRGGQPALRPFIIDFYLVAALLQLGDGFFGNAALQHKNAGARGARPERRGEMLAVPGRRIDRLLEIHVAVDVAQEVLRDPLVLLVAAR
jgi:hypothetical protein